MNPREFVKLVTGNLAVLIVLLAIGSLALRAVSYLEKESVYGGALSSAKPGYDGRTIRASYPPYRDLDPEYAKAIFTEQEAPAVRYVPFTGWRRKSHEGTAVNIEDEYRTRLSTNHQVENSVWFLGGSTMWGTGADDRNTISSIYAELAGVPVWNLGEGGYNSFQELVRLMELLAKGLKPRMVVFYDGTNEDLYCTANNHQYPTHRRAERWENYIREYPKLERAYQSLKRRQESDSGWARRVSVFGELSQMVGSVARFFALPYVKLYRKATDKRILGREESDNLNSDTPFKEIGAQAAYQICHLSPEKREQAARTTVETWLLASDILKSRGIKLKIFCSQPPVWPPRHLISTT